MRLSPCGPVVDAAASKRVRERLGPSDPIDAAWPALAPVFAASPYLAGLAVRNPGRLERLLGGEPGASLAEILERAGATAAVAPDDAGRALRRLKAELHLLTALCDLGGLWTLDQVTGALSDFADADRARCARRPSRKRSGRRGGCSMTTGCQVPCPACSA